MDNTWEIITQCFGYCPMYQPKTPLSAQRLMVKDSDTECDNQKKKKKIMSLSEIQGQMSQMLPDYNSVQQTL